MRDILRSSKLWISLRIRDSRRVSALVKESATSIMESLKGIGELTIGAARGQ